MHEIALLELRFAKSRPIYDPPVVARILRNLDFAATTSLCFIKRKQLEYTRKTNHFYIGISTILYLVQLRFLRNYDIILKTGSD